MPRTARRWIAQEYGSYHLISRVVGGDMLFGDEEKRYLLGMIERMAKGFYVKLHTFCVMSNHIHLLATGGENEAKLATARELEDRYRLMYGDDKEIPMGSYDNDGLVACDDDLGVERLRKRLGSISRFMQEVKQNFSRWYNKKHNRKGYLWGDRFKGVLVCHGQAMLACSRDII